ncbi:Translation initiation factor eIF3 subunit B [Gracilaria domingensis]|nr:Translation initiation factor eIF3 subunit B [Gracilaria domingensis]
MPGVGPDEVAPIDSIEDDFQRKKEEMRRVAKDCVVVIDNVPKIGPEKYDKLVGKLTPMFEKSARMRRDEQDKPRLTFIRNESGYTLGFAIAEYITPEEAYKAVASLNNFQLDRSHRFWACTAGELERLQHIPEEFVPPPPLPVSLKNRPNFKNWLLDERGRDQFMIRHNHETSVYWHDHIVKPQLVSSDSFFHSYKRQRGRR